MQTQIELAGDLGFLSPENVQTLMGEAVDIARLPHRLPGAVRSTSDRTVPNLPSLRFSEPPLSYPVLSEPHYRCPFFQRARLPTAVPVRTIGRETVQRNLPCAWIARRGARTDKNRRFPDSPQLSTCARTRQEIRPWKAYFDIRRNHRNYTDRNRRN